MDQKKITLNTNPKEKAWILKKKFGSGIKSSNLEDKVWINKKKFRSQSETKSFNTHSGKKSSDPTKWFESFRSCSVDYIEVKIPKKLVLCLEFYSKYIAQ